jgi:hypothetical protein
MYACIARTSPLAANQRTKNDLLIPAVKLGKEHYSQGLLEIIDKCLSLNYLDRPQSVFSLQKSLLASLPELKKKTSLATKLADLWHKPRSRRKLL